VAWLVVYSFLLIVMLWAGQQLSWRSHARAELQNDIDAAAHAAARTLVTESVFSLGYSSPSTSSVVPIDRNALITSARTEGERLARLNRVMGKPLLLKDNPDNLTSGELYAGTLDAPVSRTFIGLANTGFDPFNPDLNAVRVKAQHRNRVGASATYYIDRDVVGFRLKPPPSSSQLFPFIPMVPIAILSDPSCFPSRYVPQWWADPSKTACNSWEHQVMGRQGQDNYYIDPSGLPAFGPNTDHIPEITVTLGEKGQHRRESPHGEDDRHGDGDHDGDDEQRGDNGRLVYFDKSSLGLADRLAPLVAQIQRGVVYGDLPGPPNGQLAGQFLLNPKDGVPPGTPSTLNVAAVPTAGLPERGAAEMAKALHGILGQARVWMLYSGLQGPRGNQAANVVGFVVARVMSVQGPTGGPLTITLQPSVLVTDTAVTDWTLRNNGPRSLYNPYIARLRFVE
jgi:hypothetical protein